MKHEELISPRKSNIQADALADYICDYLDSNLDPVIAEIFEEYLAAQPELANFVKNANSGKRALEQLRYLNTESGAQ
jgi:anti-sigma factor RsiW